MRKACEVCLRNCLRLHGGEEEDEDENACLICALRKPKEDDTQAERHPSFLKKITENTMSTLKLPLSFAADQIGSLGETVILEGPGREKWRVDLQGQCSSISFGQGWNKFVVDHVLQIGDQLNFSLSEKSYFQVEVYDGFGVQKRSALDAINTPLESNSKNLEIKDPPSIDVSPVLRQKEQNKPENVNANAKQSAEQLHINLIQSSESESRIVSVPGNDIETARPLASSEDSPGNDMEMAGPAADSPGNDNEMADPAADSPGIDMEMAGPAARSEDIQTPGHPEMELAEIDNGGLLPQHDLVRGHVISKRRSVTELEKLRALRAAHNLELTNPKVIMVMTKGHVYKGFWLGIPKQFAKDWLPSETKEVTLVNKSGHTWSAKWLLPQGGLSAGWRRFALDHRLEESDVCVFELLDKVNCVMLVHIFRVLGSPEEDPGLYNRVPTPLRICEGKKSTRKLSLVSSKNVHQADSTPGNLSESMNKEKSPPQREKSPLETVSTTKSLKRKLYPLHHFAAASPAKATATGIVHNVEKSVDQASVDGRAGIGSGNEVALSGALANAGSGKENTVPPSVSHDAQSNPIASQNSVGATDSAFTAKDDVIPASADDMHEQISHFADFREPKGQDDPPSFAAWEENRRELPNRVYKVAHIYRGRNVGNRTEFLAELEGYSERSSVQILARDDDTGFWWIPSDQFGWDMLSCRIE